MKRHTVVLDTTYLLPLFGIEIIDLPNIKKFLTDILEQKLDKFEIYIPSVCFIEILYKLISEAKRQNNFEILSRYYITIPTLSSSNIINIIYPTLNPVSSEMAIKIRKAGHPDIMDCLIAGSAFSLNSLLISENKDLREILKKIPETSKLKIYSLKDFINQKEK